MIVSLHSLLFVGNRSDHPLQMAGRACLLEGHPKKHPQRRCHLHSLLPPVTFPSSAQEQSCFPAAPPQKCPKGIQGDAQQDRRSKSICLAHVHSLCETAFVCSFSTPLICRVPEELSEAEGESHGSCKCSLNCLCMFLTLHFLSTSAAQCDPTWTRPKSGARCPQEATKRGRTPKSG